MSSPYIPQKQALYDQWMSNFTTLLVADPTVYGETAGVAAYAQNQYNIWHAAFVLASDPSTKTKSVVANKDACRASLSAFVRPIAIRIRDNAGVSNQLKQDLGLTIPDRTPTPIPAPGTSPTLDVIAATPLQHTIRYHDQNTPSSRAKPFGAMFLELHGAVSATVVSDPATLPVIGMFTKNPLAVNWEQSAVGKTAYYAARWITRRGLAGPWSTISAFTVAN